MKRILILGAGTAGTMVANRLRRRLDRGDWQITVVDQDDTHLYQPGLLFIPFGRYRGAQVVKPRERFLPDGVDLILGEISEVDAEAHTVTLADGRNVPFDQLIIATGVSARPDQTPGMLGRQWRHSIFDCFTLDGRPRCAPSWRPSTAGASSCTSPTCRSSVRLLRWSSSSSPTRTSGSEEYVTGSRSSR